MNSKNVLEASEHSSHCSPLSTPSEGSRSGRPLWSYRPFATRQLAAGKTPLCVSKPRPRGGPESPGPVLSSAHREIPLLCQPQSPRVLSGCLATSPEPGARGKRVGGGQAGPLLGAVSSNSQRTWRRVGHREPAFTASNPPGSQPLCSTVFYVCLPGEHRPVGSCCASPTCSLPGRAVCPLGAACAGVGLSSSSVFVP